MTSLKSYLMMLNNQLCPLPVPPLDDHGTYENLNHRSSHLTLKASCCSSFISHHRYVVFLPSSYLFYDLMFPTFLRHEWRAWRIGRATSSFSTHIDGPPFRWKWRWLTTFSWSLFVKDEDDTTGILDDISHLFINNLSCLTIGSHTLDHTCISPTLWGTLTWHSDIHLAIWFPHLSCCHHSTHHQHCLPSLATQSHHFQNLPHPEASQYHCNRVSGGPDSHTDPGQTVVHGQSWHNNVPILFCLCSKNLEPGLEVDKDASIIILYLASMSHVCHPCSH